MTTLSEFNAKYNANSGKTSSYTASSITGNTGERMFIRRNAETGLFETSQRNNKGDIIGWETHYTPRNYEYNDSSSSTHSSHRSHSGGGWNIFKEIGNFFSGIFDALGGGSDSEYECECRRERDARRGWDNLKSLF